MNRLERVTKPLIAAMALMITAVAGGCGGQGADPILGGSVLGGSGLAADTTRPRVVSTIPVNGDTNVPTNRKVTATFSEGMAPASLQGAFTLTCSLPCVSPTSNTVSYFAGSKTATLTPGTALEINTLYTATVTSAATDIAGNALAGNQAALPAASNYVWTFTTGGTPDTTAPTVTSVNPVNLATGVALNSSINARFSEPMDQATINSTTFTLQTTTPLGPVLSGSFTYDPQTYLATFTPSSNLAANTNYTATVTIGATDLANNSLASNFVWTFTTGTTLAPTAVNLGAAASFGIASRAGLTSTGVTVVNGDIALHPTPTCTDSTGNSGASQTCLVKTYSSPTGMTVNGSIYWAGDPHDNGSTANRVTNDLNTAWTEGRNKVDTQAGVLIGELGAPGPVGKTITPGVYHEAALGLAAGNVATFDALNDANAVFIIKIDSSFTDSGVLLNRTEIKLVNGAQARNIWFITGLDITIGSGTTWNGNILAGRTATINDDSTVNGRVLAGATGAGAITITGAASPSVTTITVPQ